MSGEYTALKAGIGEAALIKRFYEENLPELHGCPIPLSEWRSTFCPPDPDEQNYIVMRGECPVGWFRLNNLCGSDGVLWLAMLSVGRDFRRRGVGRFAVDFAETFAREHGFTALGIHTTADNLPARSLYESRGLAQLSREPCVTGDGVTREGCTYRKDLSPKAPRGGADSQGKEVF